MFSNNIHLLSLFQFNKSLLNENKFLKKKLTSRFSTYICKSYIFNKCCVFFFFFINQRNLKKVSQVSNIDKSEYYKMYFKVLWQANVGKRNPEPKEQDPGRKSHQSWVLPPARPPDMEPPTAVANDGLMEVIIKLESLLQ